MCQAHRMVRNVHLRGARESVPSPRVPGACLSRVELAEAVNDWLYRHTGRFGALDGNYIARLERGAVRRPGRDYRAGFRAVLGAMDDAELGFVVPGRSHSPASRGSRSPRRSPPSRSTPGRLARPPRPPARPGHRAPRRAATRWPRSGAAATASRDTPTRSPGAAAVSARAGPPAPMSSPPGGVRCDRDRSRGGAAPAVRAGRADQRRRHDAVPAQRGVSATACGQPGGPGRPSSSTRGDPLEHDIIAEPVAQLGLLLRRTDDRVPPSERGWAVALAQVLSSRCRARGSPRSPAEPPRRTRCRPGAGSTLR